MRRSPHSAGVAATPAPTSPAVPAIFTEQVVTFKGKAFWYVLNRVDLGITSYIPILKEREAGRCTIKDTPKRAF